MPAIRPGCATMLGVTSMNVKHVCSFITLAACMAVALYLWPRGETSPGVAKIRENPGSSLDSLDGHEHLELFADHRAKYFNRALFKTAPAKGEDLNVYGKWAFRADRGVYEITIADEVAVYLLVYLLVPSKESDSCMLVAAPPADPMRSWFPSGVAIAL
jgi:hypothetical protein